MSWRGSPTCRGKSDVGSNPPSGWCAKTGSEGDSRTPKPNQPSSQSVSRGHTVCLGPGSSPRFGETAHWVRVPRTTEWTEGNPWGPDGEESSHQGRRCRLNPWVGKIPWGRAWQPTQYSCLENPHGQRSLAGYRPQGRKESNMTE